MVRKSFLFLILAAAGLASVPAARAQGYTDALLTSINANTDFPCGNDGGTATANIQRSLQAAQHNGGGTVDLTCYQGAITLTGDIFSPITAKILFYLPEHAVTVNANATIPANIELCGGPGASIAAGVGFTLTNHATACFNGFTSQGTSVTPGLPDLSLQFNLHGVFAAVPNSSVDPSTGDVTLGGILNLNSIAAIDSVVTLGSGYIFLGDLVNPDFEILQNSDTLPMVVGQDGDGGVLIGNAGLGGVRIIDEGSFGVSIDASYGGGTGPISLTSAAYVLATNWLSPGTDTLANLTTQMATLPSEGYVKLCSDCDTPPYAGAPATNTGDNAGAEVIYIQGGLYAWGKVSNVWDFTSNAVALSFINTTAATSSVNQSSPLQIFQGNLWGSGSASTTDTWEEGVVIASGTNGESEIDFLHSGGAGNSSVGALGAPLLHPAARHVSTLPTASSYPGHIANVDNSTTISGEGQTCVDAGGSGVPALAFSDGTNWKCF
jgi:hypothetical protein